MSGETVTPERTRLDAAIRVLAHVAAAASDQRAAAGEAAAGIEERFLRDWPPALANVRRELGMTPVPGAPDGFFQASLRDGTVGYFQRRTDDCLQAAIASYCQIPPHLVPDLRLNEQRILDGRDDDEIGWWADREMTAWLGANRLQLTRYGRLPRSGRWIGVAFAEDAPGATHCLVMSGQEVLFDPNRLTTIRESEWAWSDLEYAISIERS